MSDKEQRENEYLEFLNSSAFVSEELGTELKAEIKRLGFIDKTFLYGKIFSIFSLSGFLTFSFCPQFGLNPFGANPHIAHFLMKYGMWACGLFCGSIFLGSGSILKYLILSKKDISELPQIGFSSSLVISSLIYAMYMFVGLKEAQDILHSSLVFFIFWLIGGLVWEKLSRLSFQAFFAKSSARGA